MIKIQENYMKNQKMILTLFSVEMGICVAFVTLS